MANAIITRVRARRDRAIRALGMDGAFRCSEVAALRLEELKFTNTGLRIIIPRSKRDQRGAGQTIAIPEGRLIREITLLRHGLHAADLLSRDPATDKPRTGQVFLRLTPSAVPTTAAMTDRTTVRMVETTAASADLDP